MSTTPAYAAQSAKTPLAPFNIQRRAVGPHDVQIEILYCGVCHSDLHMARNEWGSTIYPVVPGHEIVGQVTAVGKQVSKFRTGDLAGVGVMVDSCRECANCRRGLQQYCTVGGVLTYSSRDRRTGEITQGGYSKSIVTTEGFVFSVSDKLPLALRLFSAPESPLIHLFATGRSAKAPSSASSGSADWVTWPSSSPRRSAPR